MQTALRRSTMVVGCVEAWLVKSALTLRLCSHTTVAWQDTILRVPIFMGSFCAGSRGLARGSAVPQLEPQVQGSWTMRLSNRWALAAVAY